MRLREYRARPLAALALATVLAGVSGCVDGFGPGGSLVFKEVRTGGVTTCALTVEGHVYCWGGGKAGQLGNDNWVDAPGPQRMPGELTFARLAMGFVHGCGIATDGRTWCWGWNARGQLGAGHTNVHIGPIEVVTPVSFVDISAGWYHTCGLTADGAAWCWGAGGQGQLGDGGFQDRPVAVPVAGDLRFARIAAGGFHTCAVTAAGAAYCWGLNHLGQLGSGDTSDSPVPRPVAGGITFRSITAGYSHSCGLSGEKAWCWGSNTYGELATSGLELEGHPGTVQPHPTYGGYAFRAVEAGRDFTCAIGTNRRPWCWGRGYEGQLGTGTLRIEATPQYVAGFAGPSSYGRVDAEMIAPGKTVHTCALSTSGAVYCWGTGEFGGLGVPGTRHSAVPIRILLPS